MIKYKVGALTFGTKDYTDFVEFKHFYEDKMYTLYCDAVLLG